MERCGCSTDLSDARWALIEPHLPPPRRGGRRRTVGLRAVINAIFYLLRTGCQWRLLPRDFPPWGTVWRYFRQWRREGLWTRIRRALYLLVRAKKGRRPRPSVVIMDAQLVCACAKRVQSIKRGVPKTTEKGTSAASMATSG